MLSKEKNVLGKNTRDIIKEWGYYALSVLRCRSGRIY